MTFWYESLMRVGPLRACLSFRDGDILLERQKLLQRADVYGDRKIWREQRSFKSLVYSSLDYLWIIPMEENVPGTTPTFQKGNCLLRVRLGDSGLQRIKTTNQSGEQFESGRVVCMALVLPHFPDSCNNLPKACNRRWISQTSPATLSFISHTCSSWHYTRHLMHFQPIII